MRHILGTALIFGLLIAQDFFMGMFGGYTATGGGDFFAYLSTITFDYIVIVLAASVIIYLILRRFFKI